MKGGFQSWVKKSMRVKELRPETALTVLNEVLLIRNVTFFCQKFLVTWYLVACGQSLTGQECFLFSFRQFSLQLYTSVQQDSLYSPNPKYYRLTRTGAI